MSRSQFWIVNSKHKAEAFCAFVFEQFEKNHYTTYRWRHGPDRSLDQNALFHVWCRQWIAYKLKKPSDDVERKEVAGMKHTIKKCFYQATSAPWMMQEVYDYSDPTAPPVMEFTSSSDWGRGEMFDVLTWMQSAAMDDGLVLESLGEYAKLQRQQAGSVPF